MAWLTAQGQRTPPPGEPRAAPPRQDGEPEARSEATCWRGQGAGHTPREAPCVGTAGGASAKRSCKPVGAGPQPAGPWRKRGRAPSIGAHGKLRFAESPCQRGRSWQARRRPARVGSSFYKIFVTASIAVRPTPSKVCPSDVSFGDLRHTYTGRALTKSMCRRFLFPHRQFPGHPGRPAPPPPQPEGTPCLCFTPLEVIDYRSASQADFYVASARMLGCSERSPQLHGPHRARGRPRT